MAALVLFEERDVDEVLNLLLGIELQMESNSEDGIVILIDSQREPDPAMANMDEDVAVVETNLAECLVGSSLKIGRSHSQLEIFDRILEDFPDAVEAVVTWEFKCDMPSEHRQFGIKWRFKRVKSTEEQVAEAMLLLSAGGHGREV